MSSVTAKWSLQDKSCFCVQRLGARGRLEEALHLRDRQSGQPILTECIHELVLESQLPHKTVNLIFPSVVVHNRLTILWGSGLLKLINKYIM